MFQTCTVNCVLLFSEFFSLETHWVIMELELGYKAVYVRACTQLLQSCPTLGNRMDCSLSDFCVHGNLQARILEWAAMPILCGSGTQRSQLIHIGSK